RAAGSLNSPRRPSDSRRGALRQCLLQGLQMLAVVVVLEGIGRVGVRTAAAGRLTASPITCRFQGILLVFDDFQQRLKLVLRFLFRQILFGFEAGEFRTDLLSLFLGQSESEPV